ncbi:ligase [Mauternbach virus]|uniref:Ligase n=1 Tax=Mauternbach virus TaxID=2486603 RepID=A0A3G3E759_9VIRU|nr:ligase [Mauternbach virus]AYP97921.1 ligase [Mauternbach virus]
MFNIKINNKHYKNRPLKKRPYYVYTDYNDGHKETNNKSNEGCIIIDDIPTTTKTTTTTTTTTTNNNNINEIERLKNIQKNSFVESMPTHFSANIKTSTILDDIIPSNIFTMMLLPKLPMLAKPIKFDEFVAKDWIFEEKYDGERLLIVAVNNTLSPICYTRTLRQSTIFKNAISLKPNIYNCIFDGELIYLNNSNQIVPICDTGNRTALRVQYRIFDIQLMNSFDMRNRTLAERKRLLVECLYETDHVKISKYSPCIDQETIMKNFDAIVNLGGEGLILKNTHEPYVSGERLWLKVKALHLKDNKEEFELYAYRLCKDKNNVPNILECGYYEKSCECISDNKYICMNARHNNKFIHVSNVSSGMTYRLRTKLKLLSDPITGFFPRQLIVTIIADKITANKSLRHPSLYKIRTDLNTIDVQKFL